LGMCNTGKNCNSSQFFIALADVNRLTGKHVVRTLTHSTRARHEELLEQ
jgi:cyclophilin family peptidyl-prolyl cis-trans isomerase